jgi:hypothetical protein
MARALSVSWLDAYLAYTAESESPEEYHLWVGISAIAGALRRQVFVDMGYFSLYPNMYIVLVGPAGRCKKSTAMRIGRGMLSQNPKLDFTTDSVTRERLIQDLSQAFKDGQSAMTAYSSEFASLLTSSGMDMVVFLTDIFDCPQEWSHKTKVGGTNKIKAPFLNLIGATTPDWISKAMPLDTVGIGLTSRIVFVFADTPRRKPPFPKLTPEQKILGEMLAQDLIAISDIQGEYTFSPDALKAYEEWYEGRVEEPNTSGDPRLAGYFERKPMHLLKLAMIVAASRRDEPVIELADLEGATELFRRIEERMPRVFAAVGKNPINADKEELYAYLLHTGGMTMGQMMDRFSYALRKDELIEVIETLMMIGKIRLDGKVYRPTNPV